MLSGETANGEYSVEAVQCMSRTCCEAESMVDTDRLYEDIRHAVLQQVNRQSDWLNRKVCVYMWMIGCCLAVSDVMSHI